MKTFKSLIEELISDVSGFTVATNQLTSLSADITETDTVLTVDDSSGVATGLIEVGDELMWVRNFDATAGAVTLLPQGRGYAGTTPAAHSAGDTVVISPAYPRSRIKTAINDSVRALWPLLYCVSTTEFTFSNATALAWPLPADAEQVLDVRYRDSVGNWQRIRGWEVERSTNLIDFPTGVCLRITQGGIPFGNTIQVVYGKAPTELSDESDPFTACGYEERIADLVLLDVKARLLPMLDVARLQMTTVAATQQQDAMQAGTAIAMAEKFRSAYTSRLAIERDVLNKRYPARIHITR